MMPSTWSRQIRCQLQCPAISPCCTVFGARTDSRSGHSRAFDCSTPERGRSATQLLHCSLSDTFAGAVPQVFDIAHRWLTEQPLILAGEVRGIAVSDAVACTGSIEPLAKHEPARLL